MIMVNSVIFKLSECDKSADFGPYIRVTRLDATIFKRRTLHKHLLTVIRTGLVCTTHDAVQLPQNGITYGISTSRLSM